MQFHLNYAPPKASFSITHHHTVFLTGSCFSNNIGDYFRDYKFKELSNPVGNLFNPASIASFIQDCIKGEVADEKYLVMREGLYYSLMHHSYLNHSTKKGLLVDINDIYAHSTDFLKNSDVLIITFGTAFAYRHVQLNKTVTNCHKLPGSHFQKKLLSVEQIVKNYSTLIQQLQLFNPGLRIIFTVSPVKYLKDGVEANALSKAILLLSVRELVKRFSNCAYFPAFELVSDDLRDYRFYKKDLAHPNNQAIEYVWNKFSGCYFDEQTQTINNHVQKLNFAQQHHIINPGSKEIKKLKEFIAKQKEEIRKLDAGIVL